MSERRFHRIKFYPTGFSNFDEIYEHKERGCIGCTHSHPWCEEGGKVIKTPSPTTSGE